MLKELTIQKDIYSLDMQQLILQWFVIILSRTLQISEVVVDIETNPVNMKDLLFQNDRLK